MTAPAPGSVMLLDANVLIALTDTDHVHHAVVQQWFGAAGAFATCPITQGALVRFLLRLGATAAQASAVVHQVQVSPRHVFWSDDVAFDGVELRGVVGHRQVTDAYLAALARHRGGRIATLDRALAVMHADVAELVTAPLA